MNVILVLCQPLMCYISLLLESQSLAHQIYLFSFVLVYGILFPFF